MEDKEWQISDYPYYLQIQIAFTDDIVDVLDELINRYDVIEAGYDDESEEGNVVCAYHCQTHQQRLDFLNELIEDCIKKFRFLEIVAIIG